MALRACALLLVSLAAVRGAEPNVTRCQTGASDILGDQKAFAVQVCNLFGSTCHVNHPALAAADCGTHALTIDTGECKVYPILEWANNGDRTGVPDRLSSVGDLGCSVSSSNGVYKFSGACVSVQCSLGEAGWAGPGNSGTGNGNSRQPVTDTQAAGAINAVTIASIPDAAKQLKTVFLSRTGNYVGTYSRSSSSSSSNGVTWTYSVGSLPTSDGNNYGPVACPSTGQSNVSAAATGITAENLRMCGSTGKWMYYNAINLVEDKSLYAKVTGDTAMAVADTTTTRDIGGINFLDGESGYRSGTASDDPRKYLLNVDGTSGSAILNISDTITPSNATFPAEIGGIWRSFGVAFYCDDYARTDLTTCKPANRKMFYVCDLNPNACFGSAAAISGSGRDADVSPSPEGSTSGALATSLSVGQLMLVTVCALLFAR